MIREQKISFATDKTENKTLPLKTWETCWDRHCSCKYQSIVPKTDQFTFEQRWFMLKHKSSKMIRKIFRIKSCHNLLPAYKSKYDPVTPSQCVTCEMPFNEHHLLFECKNFQLFQTTLKTMTTDTLSFHYCNCPIIKGEGDTSLAAALEIRYLLCEFLSLPDIHTRHRILINPIMA